MLEIKSLKDEKIQLARALQSQKGRAEKNKFLIEGQRALEWALDAGVAIDFILISADAQLPNGVPDDVRVYQTSDGLSKKATGTNYLIPIVAVGNKAQKIGRSDFAVVLDDVKDYGNIGTIVRTCHAFGIDSIISTRNDFDLYHRKTVDASRGKVFESDCRCFESPTETARHLKKNGFQIVTTSPYGDHIQSLAELAEKPVALIVGNETHGASDELMQHADIVVQIPMQCAVESLNVGVATGISIYELRLKQAIGMIEKKIKSTLGRDINVTGMLIQRALDHELKKVSDFSSKQLVFMMVLKCDQVMSIIEMQKQFGIPDAELGRFIDPLTAKKMITLDDQNNLSLTEKGAETLGKFWAVVENTEDKILEGFSEKERVLLNEFLARLKNNCLAVMDQV